MNIPDDLLCLFTAQVDERNSSYVFEIPDQEVILGGLEPGETYRVGALSARGDVDRERRVEHIRDRSEGVPAPPVDEGERREVEIEDIGEQGDGIARVERGYVIIVPDTEEGDRVTIEIARVRKNVAFGEVIERPTHF